DAVSQNGELPAHILRPGHAVLAMIAERHGRKQDACARFEVAYVLSHLGDFAGYIAAIDVRQLRSGDAFADPEVKVVHRASPDAHQHLVFAHSRVGDLFILQNLGLAELMKAHSLHWSLRPLLEALKPTITACDLSCSAGGVPG